MNLFVTSISPEHSAQALDDLRLGKQLIECVQLLSTALKVWSPEISQEHTHLGGLTQGRPYLNHPVQQWVARDLRNWSWTESFAEFCWIEWKARFGRWHASGARLRVIKRAYLEITGDRSSARSLRSSDDFCNCAANASLGLDFRNLPTFEAYRHYLVARWKLAAPRFTIAKMPDWGKTLMKLEETRA